MTGEQVQDLERALQLDEVWTEEPTATYERHVAKSGHHRGPQKISIASRIMRSPAVRNSVAGKAWN